MVNSKTRLLLLLKIFSKKTDKGHRMSVPALIHELEKSGIEADRKTLYRDIQALRDSCFDIVSSSRGYYLGSRTLSFSDLKLLLSCVDNASFITSATQAKLRDSLLSLASENDRTFLSRYSTIHSVREVSDDISRALDTICTAHANNTKISFLDESFASPKNAEPIAILSSDNGFILVCRFEGEDALSFLDIKILHNVKVLATPAQNTAPIELSGNDSIKKMLFTQDSRQEIITLKCDSSIRNAIFKKFGANASYSKDYMNTFTINVEAPVTDELVCFLARFGSSVEALSPDSLRQKLGDFFGSAYSLYKK